MATTYTLISSVTVGSGGASSIDFTSIPQNYTDLVIKITSRTESNGDSVFRVTFNSNTSTIYKWIRLLGDSGTGSSQNQDTYGSGYNTALFGNHDQNTATANTFSNGEIYITNYTSSNYKSVSIDTVSENNGTTLSAQSIWAGLWENTAAITSIKIQSENTANDIAQYSTAYLYGISNA